MRIAAPAACGAVGGREQGVSRECLHCRLHRETGSTPNPTSAYRLKRRDSVAWLTRLLLNSLRRMAAAACNGMGKDKAHQHYRSA